MVDVPAHGGLQALGQRARRPPADLRAHLRGIDGIAVVVSRPVRHVLHQRAARLVARDGAIDQIADDLRDIQVAPLFLRADQVLVAHGSEGQHAEQRACMILDMDPVPHIGAAAIDRQLLPLEGADDQGRDELFRKLVRPVVVAAIGDQGRDAEGVAPRRREMVRCRLGRRVGRARIVAAVLVEPSLVAERAIDLVGRDVHQPEIRARRFGEGPHMRAACFQQIEGADHVAHDEGLRPVDRAVDMGLGCQMDHRIGPVALEDAGQGGAIAQIGLLELVARIAGHGCERGRAGGVAQLVEIDDPAVGRIPQQPAHGRPDEAGAARHQNGAPAQRSSQVPLGQCRSPGLHCRLRHLGHAGSYRRCGAPSTPRERKIPWNRNN